MLLVRVWSFLALMVLVLMLLLSLERQGWEEKGQWGYPKHFNVAEDAS